MFTGLHFENKESMWNITDYWKWHGKCCTSHTIQHTL